MVAQRSREVLKYPPLSALRGSLLCPGPWTLPKETQLTETDPHLTLVWPDYTKWVSHFTYTQPPILETLDLLILKLSQN